MVVVAIMTITAGILLVWGYLMYVRNIEIDLQRSANEVLKDEIWSTKGGYEGARLSISEQLGWLVEGKNESDPEAIRAFLEGRAATDYEKKTLTIEELVHVLEEKLAHAKLARADARLDRDIALHSLESCKERLYEIRTRKSEFLRTIEADVKRLNNEITAETDSFTKQHDTLKDRKIAQERQKAEIERKIAETRSFLKTERLNKIRELEELLKKEAVVKTIIEIDGVIDWVSPDGKYAYINLGEGDRLVRGTKFGVFEYGKGGEVKIKGEVEAKVVEANMTKVIVTKVTNKYDPIKSGDYIFNPVYNRERAQVFVLAGNFDVPDHVFSKEEIKRRVRAIGGEVEETVTLRTDFVIVGEDFQNDPNYTKAGEIGILVIPVRDLFPYLAD